MNSVREINEIVSLKNVGIPEMAAPVPLGQA